MFPAIVATSFIIFFAMDMAGGDPVDTLVPENATVEQKEKLREELGLNQPVLLRYLKYLKGMFTGNMGTSYVTHRDVFKTFMSRLPATLELASAAVFVATLVAVPLGIYTAIHQNTWKDTSGMVFALFGVSMPNFWLGIMLIIVFSLKLGIFPPGGKKGLISLVLPAVTVGLGFAALITRTTRSAMLDVVRQDYITTARAKGVPEKKVILKHSLNNALIPIITVIGMQLSNALTGSVLAETVFSWPGVGRLIVDSIAKRDAPMVTGSIILCCVLMCVVNLIIDLIYAFFDPRIKAQYTKRRGVL